MYRFQKATSKQDIPEGEVISSVFCIVCLFLGFSVGCPFCLVGGVFVFFGLEVMLGIFSFVFFFFLIV